MKDKIFVVAVLITTIALCITMPKISESIKTPSTFDQEFATGIVQEIINEDLNPDPVVKDRFRGTQKLSVKIINGKQKGNEFIIYNTLSSLHNTRCYPGLKAVFTVKETPNGELSVWLYNQKRDIYVYLLLAIFLISLLVLGKKQGLKSILGLVFTCVLIFTVLIPAIFAGYPPILTAIFLVSIMAIVSFILISGFTSKTYCAILGTVFGVIVAGSITGVISYFAQLSGVNMEGGEQLLNLAPDYNIKLHGLLFISILIASLGAVMDVSMSIASSMQEIKLAQPEITAKDLFIAGLRVGKDITGTMSNTLILAFVGTSLPLIMMIWGYGMSFTQYINIPRIVIAILHGLAGSIGLISAVPCTAVISIIFFNKKIYLK